MTKRVLDVLKDQVESSKKTIWDDYLVRSESFGHTWEVSKLNMVHAARDTSAAFVLGKLINSIDLNMGIKVLEAIEKLQVKDSNDEMYGAFRWYREESQVIDTNAAFFILSPLTSIRLFAPESLCNEEIVIIDRMLNTSYNWFLKECENSILWYTNKIVSDGAILSCIGKITDNDICKKQSHDFIYRWLDYTEKHGYGWGENLSRGYNGVTLQGFTLIKKALDDTEEDILIRKRFNKLEKDILDTFRFNNGNEFVPTIRSYNIEGKVKLPSLIYNIAQVEGFGILDEYIEKGNTYNLAIAYLLYGDRLYLDKEDYINKGYENIKTSKIKVTHIMDHKKAYSWIGENGGMGSINTFPVIEGSYQHKMWGLGWQCFPVNMIVNNEQMSFLRFNVDDGKNIRCHPHKDKRFAFLDSALFSEHFYPDVKTNCKQKENTLIAIRSINKLRNKAKNISDSLDIQRFKGDIIELYIDERQWIVMSYENAAICVSPLMGLIAQEKTEELLGMDSISYRKAMKTDLYNTSRKIKIEIVKDKEDISLVQFLYKGELKILYDDRISSGWLIHFIDKGMNKDDLKKYIEKITVKETQKADKETPRMYNYFKHNINVKYKDKEILDYSHDPYKA